MDALSFISQGFRGHSHDHGSHHDILAGSGEDGCLPLALLDLVIYVECPRPCALSVEVLWAGASVVVVFIGLLDFMGPSSF